eukprot:3659264-Pyramimonas_sp.AAC.1
MSSWVFSRCKQASCSACPNSASWQRRPARPPPVVHARPCGAPPNRKRAQRGLVSIEGTPCSPIALAANSRG